MKIQSKTYSVIVYWYAFVNKLKKSLNRKREHLVVALDFQQRQGRDFCVGSSLPQEMLDR